MDESHHRDQPEQDPSLFHLFLSFLRLGATAFGGPAMIAYIRRIAVEKRHWLDEKTFRGGVALCQTIPGATMMQMAAYVGLKARGVEGAAASFVGFCLPAFLFMVALSALYVQSHTLPAVTSAFNGLQAVIVALIANASLSFGRASVKNWKNALNVLIAGGMFGLGIHPITVILVAAFFGWIFYHNESLPQGAGSKEFTAPARSFFLLLAAAGGGLLLLFFISPGLFDLALLMGRIDLFAFGGGFASVPLMFHEIVEIRSWLDAPTFLNGIVLGQVTPGPIVITATFVGYLLKGLPGALIATVGIFLPSFLILIGVAPYFDRLRGFPSFNRAMTGILCSFVGLLLTVTIRFALNIPWDITRILITLGAFIALFKKVDILWVVLVGTGISLIAL